MTVLNVGIQEVENKSKQTKLFIDYLINQFVSVMKVCKISWRMNALRQWEVNTTQSKQHRASQ